jgi:RNA polymerase sigma-70 factor (ECF subfamily)
MRRESLGWTILQGDGLKSFGEGFEQVLGAAKAGAEWAWREIYDALSPTVLGYLRGRSAEDPEDLLGQVFLQVLRAIGSFSGGEDAFRGWVLTIARRRVIDDYRRRKRGPIVHGTQEELEAAGPAGDTEREAVGRLQAAEALTAIRGLSPDQQDVLLLRLVAELSLDEVAGVLGKSVGAVKALQHRGLVALAKRIPREAVSP